MNLVELKQTMDNLENGVKEVENNFQNISGKVNLIGDIISKKISFVDLQQTLDNFILQLDDLLRNKYKFEGSIEVVGEMIMKNTITSNMELQEMVSKIQDIPELSIEENLERKRYIRCYMMNEDGCDGNWGERVGAFELVKTLKLKSICDVGCGIGNFLYSCVTENKELKGYGVDPASVAISELLSKNMSLASDWPGAIKNGTLKTHKNIEYHTGSTCYIPLPDKHVDIVTSFDCWEHIFPDDIDKTIDEAKRVAKSYVILSIGLTYSNKSFEGYDNHRLVKPREWWVDKLTKNFTDVEVINPTHPVDYDKTFLVKCTI